MGKFTEYKLKKQADTNSVTKYRQFREREIANQASQYIVEQLKNYENSNSKFVQSYNDRFFDSDGKYISDKYRRNTQVELLFANKEKERLEKQRQELISLLDSYGSNFKEDWLQETQNYLNDAGKVYDKIIKTYSDDNELFSGFKNADEFYDWSEKQKQKEALRNTDLNSVKTEISDLTNALNNILSVEGQKALITNQYNNLMYSSNQYPSAEGQAELNAIKAELDAFDKKQKELEGVFGSSSDIKKKLEELNKTFSDAKELQETEALTTDALNASDLEEFSQKGIQWGQDTYKGGFLNLGTYNNDKIIYYRENSSDIMYDSAERLRSGSYDEEYAEAAQFAQYMTEDEYKVYSYYVGKGDKEKAQKYLDSIHESVNARAAGKFYEENLEDSSTAEKIIFGFAAGIGQFGEGLSNLFDSESDKFVTSPMQMASAQVREDLKDKSFNVWYNFKTGEWEDKINGNSIGQIGYDLASTTGNMLPSILTSAVVSYINPVAGQMVGSALMGASAKGNAYAEMINLGYTKEQASNYSTLVGASEAGLQFLLGGIGKLGGSVSSKAISSAVSKIDNVFARTAIQLGGNMFSEGAEEYIQEVLDPFFKNIAFGEDNDIRFISEDALYSGLLGALSAGVLEGGSTVGGNVSTYRTGKQLKAAGVTAEQLSELGSKLSINSEAYKLAGRINENTGAYTIGRMFNALNTEITAQNKAEIKEALRAKSINPISANSIANWMERVVAGEVLTAKQKAALENNPVLGEVMRDVLYERNTTALQRQAGLDSIRSQLEEYQIKQALDKAVKKAEKKKAKNAVNNTANTQDTQYTAQQVEIEDFKTETDTSLAESEKANEANSRVSDNGRTFSTKTGEDLDIVGIASVKDKTFKTADGQTVDSKDVSFATENEAVLYDSVLSMDLPTEIANAIIDGYIPSDNISVTDYLLGSNLAYRYGYAGAKDIELMLDSDVRNIPEHLSKGLYNLGRETAKAETNKEQAEIDEKKAQKSENKAKKKGKVTFDNKELSKEFEDSLTDIQRESIKGIKVIAEVLGNDVNLFASYIAKEGPYKGKRVYKDSNGNVKLAPNGFYNPDGSINLDVNSGNLGEGTILYTLSHELTHHIRKWSPAKFKVLADFVVEQYSDNGIKINDLVYEQMAKAKKNGKSISYGTAYEEVIADACSTMLLDSNAIEKLAQKDKTLFEKIKSFIKDFIDKINTLHKNFSPDAKEAQYVKDIKGMTDKLQALWFEGLEDAGEAYSVAKEGKTVYKSKTSLHRYSFRDSESGMANDFLSPYNEELTHLINERGDYIVDSFEKLEHIVNIAFDNPKHKATAYFGVVNAEKLNQIKNSINNMPKASKDILFKLGRDYSIATTLDSIRHIVDEKSLGRDDVLNYLDRFADTILEFDTVAYSTYVDSYGKKNVGLLFKKTFPDGMLVSFDLVSNKKRSIVLQTLYLNRADYQKKKSAETLLMPKASAHTPEARVGQTSKHSLPQDSESSQEKFSLRESVEETKDLVAVHNLSEEKLLKSLQLGGLPMPSIAIIRAKEGHENFGTISLVFGKETIDPQFFRSNKVYSGDAWTPTYPRVEYKIDENVVEKGVDEVERLIKSRGFGKDDFGYLSSISEDSFKYGNTEEVANKTALQVAYLIDKGIDFNPVYKEGQLSDFGRFDNFVVKHIAEALGKERIVELHNNSKGVESAVEEIRNLANEYKANKYKDNEKLFAELSKNPFYGENNFGFSQAHEIVEGAYKYFNNGSRTKIDEWETKKEIADLIDKTDYKKWVNNLFDGFIAKEGIRNNKDLFTPSGNRRSFEALHYEHNLENVIKAMKEEGTKGVGAFGGGNIFGASTTEFSSIADIKNSAEKRLQSLSDEEFSEIKKGFADRFFELASSLPNNKDSFTATDDAANVLVEAISKYKTKSGIANYIRRECQGWATYSDYVVDDLIELVSDIQQMPTKYFEAKPQRAVGFDEVKAVVIPDNSAEELKSALKSKSFNVLEYQSGNEQDRAAVLNSIEDVKFSDRDSDGNTLSKEQQEFFKDSKVRDKDGNLLVMYHGTPNAGFTKFKSGTYFTQYKWYADRYQGQGASSLGVKKTANNPDTYAVYLNIKKPFDTRNKTERDIFYNEYYRQWGTGTDLMESGLPDWMDGMDLQEFLEENGYDYDGLILDEGGVGGYGEEVKSRGLSYVAFSSEQVKNIDNKAPTSDADIRYSGRDSTYMEAVNNGDMDTAQKMVEKAAREAGYTVKVYHGTPNFGFTKLNVKKSDDGISFFATEDITVGSSYAGAIASEKRNISEKKSQLSKRAVPKLRNQIKVISLEFLHEYTETLGHYDSWYMDSVEYITNRDTSEVVSPEELIEYATLAIDTISAANLNTINGQRKGKRNSSAILTEETKQKLTEVTLKYAQKLSEVISPYQKSGVYGLYANTENHLVIDAQGSRWNDIKSDVLPSMKEAWTTRDVALYAKKNGYSGVTFKNIVDPANHTASHPATVYAFFNPKNQLKSADTVTYDLFGKVIPLSKRFNTTNKDIRYSDRDPDSFEARQEIQKQLIKENAILKEDNILLKELVALQRKVTNGTILKKSSVDAVSKKIMKQLNVKGNTQELSKLLSDVYSYILRGTEVTWEDITEKAQPAINWIYENMQTEKVVDEYTLGVLREIRKSRVSLDETQKAEINAVLGSYKDFQKYTLGKIIIAKDGLSMDSWWGEMNEKYPNIFDSDISSNDMPTALIGILDNLSNSLYEEVYNYQSEMTKQDVLTEIYDGYWDVSTLHTVADQNQKKINELKAKHKEKLSKVRSSHNKKIIELKNKHKQEIKEIKAALREKSLQREQDIRTKYQESRQKSIEGREKTAMRHKIQKKVQELHKLYEHGTKERNVKIGLQKAVAEAIAAINGDTVKLEKLKEHYSDIIKNKVVEDIPAYFKQDAAVIEQAIEETIDKVGDTPLSKMNMEQLNQVYKLYSMVLTTIRNVNKLWRNNKLEDLRTRADSVMSQVSKLPALKEERGKKIGKVQEYIWNELIPIYAFETVGSEAFTELFWDSVEGMNTWAKDIEESLDFAEKTRKKYNLSSWDRNEVHSIKLESGKTMRLTLEHMMSIYAYSKRKQAEKHMTLGGFFFDSNETFTVKKGVHEVSKSSEASYKISLNDMQTITAKMNEVAKGSLGYVDEMQAYLTKMGEKGNEVSRVLWGIDIFTEKVYFPLKSKADFTVQPNTPAQSSSLKNDGMTKETVPNASNPIILQKFDDVWSNHVNRMSQYHGFVLPIENLNKVFGYGKWLDGEAKAVSTVIESRHGAAAKEYISKFIDDLNGNVLRDSVKNPLASFFTNIKKTTVAMSGSTVAQQPTAIIRAMALVNPKYFVRLPHRQDFRFLKKYELIKKHAPVAFVKEMGGFEAGSGRRVQDVINESLKIGWDKAKQKIDDITMFGAEMGDVIGWCAIWDAVEREVQSQHKNVDVGSQEYFKLVGDRFTKVIVYTQVFDSTLSRSGFMRSNSEIMKMLTAYGGEPTVSVNMMYSAILKAKRGGSKWQSARTLGVVYASIIVAAAAASVYYALRDDDDDETFGEKFAEAWADKLFGGTYGLTGELNPLTQLPAIKDIISIFDGWDVERMDVAIFKDLKDAIDDLKSDNKSDWRKIEDFTGAIGAMFGIPVKNILRSGREIYNAFKMGYNSFFGDVESDGFWNAFGRGFSGEKKPKEKEKAKRNTTKYNNSDILEALEEGSLTTAAEMIEDLVAERTANYIEEDEELSEKEATKKAQASVRSAVTQHLKPLYVEAYQSKDQSKMRELRYLMRDLKIYGSVSDILSTCNNWVKESRKK